MEENQNKKNVKFALIGIIVVFVLVGAYFLVLNLLASKSPSDWCTSGDSWENPLNGQSMIKSNIVTIASYSVCLASANGKEIYAFSKDESVIFMQNSWSNFTRVK